MFAGNIGKSRSNLKLAAAGLVASASWCSIAQAQAVPTINAPAIRSPTDENYVNLASGGLAISQGLLSAGAHSSGFPLSRSWTGNGWRNSYVITINATTTLFTGNFADISIGGVTSRFHLNSGVWSSDKADGATLTSDSANWYYTDRTGVIYTFAKSNGGKYYYTADLNSIPAISIAYPSGEKLSFTYDTITINSAGTTAIRLKSIFSTNGWQLYFTYPFGVPYQGYAIQSIYMINNGVDYCDPTVIYCSTMTQSWANASFSSTSSGGNIVESVSAPLGVTKYTTNASSQLVSIQRPVSSVVNETITYDSNGRVATIVRDGMTWTYSWTLTTSPIADAVLTGTITDPLGHVRVTKADATTSVITSDTDALSRTTSYTADSAGRITQVTYPEGNYIKLAYDGRGNITTRTSVAKPGSSLSNIVTSAVYPTTCTNSKTCNEATSITDERLNTTNFGYDATTGFLTSATSPAVGGISPQIRYSYSSLYAYYKTSASGTIAQASTPIYELTGVSVCRTTASCTGGADEIKTTIGYGPQVAGTANNLLPVSITTGAGDGSLSAMTSSAYDVFGNLLTTTDPLGHTTRYRYDAARDVTGVVGSDPDGAGPLKNRAQRITYNADGLVTLAEQGTVPSQADADWASFTTLQQVATSYDAADRKSQETAQASGSTYAVTQYGYDGGGRPQCTTVRMNPAVFASLPSACTLGTTGSYGTDRISYNSYDNANQLTSITDGYGTSFARVTTGYAYSLNGKVIGLSDGKGNLTTYIYDGFDRLSQTQYPSPTTPGTSNTADYEQLGYDANGNITSQRLRDGNNVALGYDVLNRLTSRTSPHIPTATSDPNTGYGYDLLGDLTSATDQNSDNLSFAYDALGRIISQTSVHGGTKAMQYDLAGRRTRLTWQDGFYVTYDYDNVNEMTAIHENGAAANLVGFTYDDLGERTAKSYANGTGTAYGYDPISRLTSLTISGSTYPDTITLSNYSPAGEIGSRTQSNDTFAYTGGTNGSTAYTPNGLNQYSAIGGTTQTYDARGNATLGYNVATYVYNSRNEPVSQTGLFVSETASYNPLGRLDMLATEAQWLDYDGDHLITELSTSTGSIARRYVFGPGTDEPLVWYEGSGTSDKRFLDADERGSIIRGTTATAASSFNTAYDEYGNGELSNPGRFSFTGQAGAGGLGLIDYKSRMYMGNTGRFMQTDPIGYADGPNWYNYVHGNPVNNIDPIGLATPNAIDEAATDAWPDIVVRGGLTPDTSNFTGVSVTIQQINLPQINIPSLNQPQSPQGGEIVVTAYNGKYHDKIVAGLTSVLRNAGVQVVNEFAICIVNTATCARADIFGIDPKSGKLFVVEVKTGPGAKFTGNQLLVYPHIEEGGLVYSPDPRVNDFGLAPGEPLPSIYGYEYYKQDPNSNHLVIPF